MRLTRNWRASDSRRAWLLALGVALVAILLAANDAAAVARVLASVRWRVLAVIAAHLPVIVTAALGWRVLLDQAQQPGLLRTLRLRWIKEAVNALLPVAQVGGDVVRAQLAAGPALPLRTAAASCIVDAVTGLVSLFPFLLAGLGLGVWITHDPAMARIGAPIVAAGALVVVALAMAPRAGLFRLIDRALALSGRAFGALGGLGERVQALAARRDRVVASILWHLAAWALGALETSAALWAIGLDPGLERAMVLESMAQGARAVGFLIPGALGVQESGYLLVCAILGIPADQALALSLLRRVRELALGAPGLIAWRATNRGGARLMQPAPSQIQVCGEGAQGPADRA